MIFWSSSAGTPLPVGPVAPVEPVGPVAPVGPVEPTFELPNSTHWLLVPSL